MAIKISVDYKKLKRQLDKMKKAPYKALRQAEADIRKRAPGWIASGVVERYNLEGSKSKGKAAILDGSVGRLKIDGSLVNNDLKFKYSGRRLTPVHFGMTPKIKPFPGSPYTLKWKVRRDGPGAKIKIKKLTKKQRANIGRNYTHQSTQNSPKSPWMLQPTGAKDVGKTQYIPFQRRGQSDPFGYVKKSISLPQMVTQGKGGPPHPEVAKHLYENAEKRIAHYLKREIEAAKK